MWITKRSEPHPPRMTKDSIKWTKGMEKRPIYILSPALQSRHSLTPCVVIGRPLSGWKKEKQSVKKQARVLCDKAMHCINGRSNGGKRQALGTKWMPHAGGSGAVIDYKSYSSFCCYGQKKVQANSQMAELFESSSLIWSSEYWVSRRWFFEWHMRFLITM